MFEFFMAAIEGARKETTINKALKCAGRSRCISDSEYKSLLMLAFDKSLDQVK